MQATKVSKNAKEVKQPQASRKGNLIDVHGKSLPMCKCRYSSFNRRLYMVSMLVGASNMKRHHTDSAYEFTELEISMAFSWPLRCMRVIGQQCTVDFR